MEKSTSASSNSAQAKSIDSLETKANYLKFDLDDLNELKKLTSKDVADLAKRLEEDDYPNAFAGLHDWHLLRAIAFNIPDLVEPYRHLLDLEPFDEC